jgi:hypothetical protein
VLVAEPVAVTAPVKVVLAQAADMYQHNLM